jgi:uncharacterized protein YndB with AHSA1/START domain
VSVPTVTRTRTIAAPRERVWRIVSDPRELPRWWPGLQRVEEATPEAWTKVLKGEKSSVRADFTRLEADDPRRLVWRQEVEETPFQRFLARSETEISLEPAGEGTEVRIRSVQKLRGLARLGGLLVRRATARLLDEALEGLDRLAAGSRP